MTQPLPPYVLGRVAGVEPLTPHMRRITLESDDWLGAESIAPDQQVKLFFARDGGVPEIPAAPEDGSGVAGWYARYLAVPEERRPWMRSYTVRALDPEAGRMARTADASPATQANTSPSGSSTARTASTSGSGRCTQCTATSAGEVSSCSSAAPATSITATARTSAGSACRIAPIAGSAVSSPTSSRTGCPDGARYPATAGPSTPTTSPSAARAAHRLAGPESSPCERSRCEPSPCEPALREPTLCEQTLCERSPCSTKSITVRRQLVGERGLDKRVVAFTGYWRRDMTQDDAPTEQDIADATAQMEASDYAV